MKEMPGLTFFDGLIILSFYVILMAFISNENQSMKEEIIKEIKNERIRQIH